VWTADSIIGTGLPLLKNRDTVIKVLYIVVVSCNSSKSRGAKMRSRTRDGRSKTWSEQTFFCILLFMHMHAVWQSFCRRY